MRPSDGGAVRPMADADIPQVATRHAEAFETEINTPARRRILGAAAAHSLVTDPDGSFVSDVRDGVSPALHRR